MDRDHSKKRDRDERKETSVAAAADQSSRKKRNKKESKRMEPAAEVLRVDNADAFRPPGLFEFPWPVVPETEPEVWDPRHVFYSSLVDGCSAAIGIPGDRLFPTASRPFCLLEEPPEGEAPDGGGDCIWSFVLGEPLSNVYSKGRST